MQSRLADPEQTEPGQRWIDSHRGWFDLCDGWPHRRIAYRGAFAGRLQIARCRQAFKWKRNLGAAGIVGWQTGDSRPEPDEMRPDRGGLNLEQQMGL